jgi:hypothetical protein
MSNTFNKNNCFGANRESIEAGDYIQKKKARATYCNSNVCIKKNTGTYENYNLLHTAQQLDTYNCYLPFNKYNLNRNLFTELDTSGVCVLRDASNGACATRIDASLNIFDNYIIDPSGVLFGNSVCGINNFVDLMVDNKLPNSQKYSVIYNTNFSSLPYNCLPNIVAPVDALSPYNQGSLVTILNSNNLSFFTCNGAASYIYVDYTLDSWNTNPDNSGTKYYPGNQFSINSNTTLYAIYRETK